MKKYFVVAWILVVLLFVRVARLLLPNTWRMKIWEKKRYERINETLKQYN